MADRPRPPLNTIDLGWEDDTEDAAAVVPPGDPAAAASPRPGAISGARPFVQPGSKLGSAPVAPPPPSEPPPPSDRSVDGETAVLPADELDQLVGRSSGPDLNKTSDTIPLGSQDIDRMLERDARGGAAPWGGPAFAPTPEPGTEDVNAAFDDMFGGGPPPSSGRSAAASTEQPFQAAIDVGPPSSRRQPPPPPAPPFPLPPPPAPPPPPSSSERFDLPPAFAPPPPPSPFYPPPAPPSQPSSSATIHGLGPPPVRPAPPARPARSSGSRMTIVIVAGAAVAISFTTVLVKRLFYARPDKPQVTGIVVPVGATEVPATGTIDDEVKAALEKLREGLRGCVKDNIQVLPGTSPAVPASLSALGKNGFYASAPSDWKTPVWACTRFQIARPQRFQLQWQQVKRNTEGMAVAWIDDDADGKADRAFGFKATLKKRGEADVGEITTMEPTLPIAAPR